MTGVLFAMTVVLSQVSLEGRVLSNANGAYFERGSDRIAAAPGTVVQPGDRLTTQGGTTTLRWGDNTIVYCGPRTTLSMAKESELVLEAGEVRVVRRGPDGLQVRARDVEVTVRQGVGRVRIEGTDVRVNSERGDVTAARLAQSGRRRPAAAQQRFVSYLQEQANILTEGTTRVFAADGSESSEDAEAGWGLDPESVVMEGAGNQNQSLLSGFASDLASSTPSTSMTANSSAPTSNAPSPTPSADGTRGTNYEIGQQNLAALNASALATIGGLSSSAIGGSGFYGLSDQPEAGGILGAEFRGIIDGIEQVLAQGTMLDTPRDFRPGAPFSSTPTFITSQSTYRISNLSKVLPQDGIPSATEYWSIANFGPGKQFPDQVTAGQIEDRFDNTAVKGPISIAGGFLAGSDFELPIVDAELTAIRIEGAPAQYLLKWNQINFDPVLNDSDTGPGPRQGERANVSFSPASGGSPYQTASALDTNATFAFGEFTVSQDDSGNVEVSIRQTDVERLKSGNTVELSTNVEYEALPKYAQGENLRGSRVLEPTSFSQIQDRTRRAAFTTLMAETLHDFAARTGQTRFVIDGKIIDISGYRKQLPR